MNNSEILFIYDAKMCNPNGDMDNENKPRMDGDTETNLVSDLRLKRYIRDYIKEYKDGLLFVTSEAQNAKDRLEQLKKEKKEVLDTIDARLFGAVTTDENAKHYSGPVQFNWGYSLNKVELQESKTTTSSFNDGKGIGKDFRVNYSVLAFSGSINAKVGEYTKLTEEDIKLLDEAMINAIPANRTRSKIGQTPRLYMRIEMKDDKSFLKDMREYIEIDKKDDYKLRDVSEYKVKVDKLVDYLRKNMGEKGSISKIFYWIDDNFNVEKIDENKEFFKEINAVPFE